jgi:hypothetical protein
MSERLMEKLCCPFKDTNVSDSTTRKFASVWATSLERCALKACSLYLTLDVL